MDLMAAHTLIVRNALAIDSGCAPEALATHGLTITRAPQARVDDGILAIAKTMGTGTVLSVEPTFVDWARTQAPATHYHAMQPLFLGRLASEMTNGGLPAEVQGSSLGFTLGEVPGAQQVPSGLTLEERDREWMLSNPAIVREFDNALEGRDATDLPPAALVLVAEGGRCAAVAGIWNHWEGGEIDEIGIDVAREFRGQGLAAIITNAACRWILDRGRTPIYTTQVSNLRSQRVAAACGFRPLWAWSSVRRQAGVLVPPPAEE